MGSRADDTQTKIQGHEMIIEPFLVANKEYYDERWPGLIDSIPGIVEMPGGLYYGSQVLSCIDKWCEKAPKKPAIVDGKSVITPERELIINYLREHGRSSPKDIASAIEKDTRTVHKALSRMCVAGIVSKDKATRQYALSDAADYIDGRGLPFMIVDALEKASIPLCVEMLSQMLRGVPDDALEDALQVLVQDKILEVEDGYYSKKKQLPW